MPAPTQPPHGGPPEAVAELLPGSGVLLEPAGRRADVVLASPQNRNAQTPNTWRALAALGSWLPSVADVVVLRAQGPTFSAGLDRRAFSREGLPGQPGLIQLAALGAAELDATIAAYQQAFACWSGDGMITVAAVQGHAVGAGFQLALAADLRICADDARFSMRETSLGLVPDLGGTHPLVAAVGYPRALEICATGRWVDAAEALQLGLVQQVVPAAGLAAATDALVGALLAAPRSALLATAALLRPAAGREPGQQRAAERLAQAEMLRELAATDRDGPPAG